MIDFVWFVCWFGLLGRPVVVKLNTGEDYRGKINKFILFIIYYSKFNYEGVLACLDGYMNIAIEQTEEYMDGQLKARYGDCFLRGNNGKFYFIIPHFHSSNINSLV